MLPLTVVEGCFRIMYLDNMGPLSTMVDQWQLLRQIEMVAISRCLQYMVLILVINHQFNISNVRVILWSNKGVLILLSKAPMDNTLQTIGMEELPHIMQARHMEETPTPNMQVQEAMGMDQVTRMEHPHINRLHLADISLMVMNPMVITGDIIEGRIACLVAASSLLLEMLELTYLKPSFGSFLVNATNW